MKLPNSLPSQANVRIVKIEQTLQLKITRFQLLRERTYHSENEEIYHPNFAWYVERSSSVDTSPKSYHLTAFELINQLPYINFPTFECGFF